MQGLISKHITGPLWRILESNLHILDLPQYYQRLLTFVSNCKVPSGFMTGKEVPFPEVAITKDSVWIALVTQSTKYDHFRGVSRNPGRGVLTRMLSMNGVWSCMQLVGRSSRRLGSAQLYRAYCTSDQLQQRRCFRASSFL